MRNGTRAEGVESKTRHLHKTDAFLCYVGEMESALQSHLARSGANAESGAHIGSDIASKPIIESTAFSPEGKTLIAMLHGGIFGQANSFGAASWIDKLLNALGLGKNVAEEIASIAHNTEAREIAGEADLSLLVGNVSLADISGGESIQAASVTPIATPVGSFETGTIEMNA